MQPAERDEGGEQRCPPVIALTNATSRVEADVAKCEADLTNQSAETVKQLSLQSLIGARHALNDLVRNFRSDLESTRAHVLPPVDVTDRLLNNSTNILTQCSNVIRDIQLAIDGERQIREVTIQRIGRR